MKVKFKKKEKYQKSNEIHIQYCKNWIDISFKLVHWIIYTSPSLVTKLKHVHIIMLFTYRTKSGKIKTSYKMDYLNLGCDVDFVFAGPTINAAAVLG